MIEIPIDDNNFLSGVAYAGYPILSDASNGLRNKIIFDLSSFVIKISNQIIFYTLTHLKDSLSSERNNVAFAFLQRAAVYHISNHKLSKGGISIETRFKRYTIKDEYKTMPLSRSVYEHLAMFYFLYKYPSSQDQSEIIWNTWKLVSKKNQVKENLSEFEEERQKAINECEKLCEIIRNNTLAQKCVNHHKGQFETCLSGNTVFTIIRDGDDYIPQKLSYQMAWKYLYDKSNTFSLTYNFLSMHSHPTYDGLAQFYNQDEDIAFPLYESCHFMLYLCRLFMEQLHIDKNKILETCTEHDKGKFSFLSRDTHYGI